MLGRQGVEFAEEGWDCGIFVRLRFGIGSRDCSKGEREWENWESVQGWWFFVFFNIFYIFLRKRCEWLPSHKAGNVSNGQGLSPNQLLISPFCIKHI